MRLVYMAQAKHYAALGATRTEAARKLPIKATHITPLCLDRNPDMLEIIPC